VLLGVIATVVVVMVSLQAREHIRRGTDALRDARAAVAKGDVDAAASSFGDAELAFEEGVAATEGLAGRIARVVPLLGNNVDVVRGVAIAGRHLSGAGSDLSAALGTLPGGIDALAPRGGKLPLATYTSLSGAAASARAEADAAVAAMSDTPGSSLLPVVRDARFDAIAQVDEAQRAFAAGEALLAQIPRFAGGEGPRRYLVLAENPAELRGTGGIWGAYMVVTFRGGKASFGEAATTQSLPDLSPDQIPGIGQDFRDNYDRVGGAGSWQNMNITPDLPSAAHAALQNFAVATGRRLDGVITADPFALAALLKVTGPTRIPDIDRVLTAGNVVDFTTFDAYVLFAGSGAGVRKETIGGVAAAVLEEFLAVPGEGQAKIRALASSAARGNLQLYAVDPDVQAAFKLAGVTGSFDPGDGDVLSVSVTNGAGNKVDRFATRRVSYDVQLGGDHEAVSLLRTAIRNDAPTTDAPRYVIGPYEPGLEAGDQRPWITFACHAPCELIGAERDDLPVKVFTGSELSVPFIRDFRTIPSGTEGTFTAQWRSRGAWEGNDSAGNYTLSFLGQTTIVPTQLDVRITAPPGTRIVWANQDMNIDGQVATWRGTPGYRMTFEVRFQAPLPSRWLRNVMRAL